MSTRTTPRPALGLPALPIDRYRGFAAVLLAGLLVIAALAPLGSRNPDITPVLQPTFDGQPAVTLADALFDYPAESQRQPVEPPSRLALLREPGLTTRTLRYLAGEMLVESSNPEAATAGPPNPHPVRDSILMGGPDRWTSLEEGYRQAGGGYGTNGLAIVEALRATITLGAERERHQRQALFWANQSLQMGGPDSGPYQYNWGLVQLALGHYQQAASALDLLIKTGSSTEPAVRFHQGVALIRLGEPAAAIAVLKPLTSGTDTTWRGAAAEAIGDAQAASGDTAGAAAAYQQEQAASSALDWDLYEKWVRLELERGGIAGARAMIAGLAARFPDEPRLAYDDGRLLLVAGQPGAAVAAFRNALSQRPDDPVFHVALGEALLAAGDARKARPESDAALQAMNVDTLAGGLNLAYGKLNADGRYNRSIGQAALRATLLRAGAQGAQGQVAEVRTLAAGAEAAGAGSDPAKAAWFRYYAGLLYAAAGLRDEAQARFQPAAPAPAPLPGPSRGTLLLAWARLLPAGAAHDGGAVIATAAGGTASAPPIPADAAEAMADYELARKLDSGATAPEAAPFYRAAAAWEALQASDQAQPPQAANGTPRAVLYRLAEADYLQRQKAPLDLTALRYAAVIAVAPAEIAAYTNRGFAYYQAGDPGRARQVFVAATQANPDNPTAAHDLGVLALRGGPADLGLALSNLATGRQGLGSAGLAGSTAVLPAPDLAGSLAAPDPGPGARLPALLALALLLLHTLVPAPAPATAPGGPGASPGSILDRLGTRLAGRLPLVGTGGRAGVLALAVAVLVGAVAWAWALAANDLPAALAWLPLTLPAALVALGAQEGVQWLAVRGERRAGRMETRPWPLGLLLSILGAPFGLVYGWLLTTHAGAATDGTGDAAPLDADLDGDEPRPGVVAAPPAGGRRGRGTAVAAPAPAPAALAERVPLRSWATMGPAARVALGGLLANAVLAAGFAVLYGLFGHPLWRVLLLGNLAVLAFTAVAEPAADGWALWRRSPLLWLLLFLVAAAGLTVLLLGAW